MYTGYHRENKCREATYRRYWDVGYMRQLCFVFVPTRSSGSACSHELPCPDAWPHGSTEELRLLLEEKAGQ